MKDKSDKWRLASLGLNDEKDEQSLVHEFIEPLGKVESLKNRYGVFAKDTINSGSFIEEVPALILDTTHEDIQNKIINDKILEYFSIKYPFTEEVFEKEGHPLIIPLGNFILYKEDLAYNAVYDFSRTFNTFLIRAVKNINAGEEIILKPIHFGYRQVGEKTMGCGCGKKKKENQSTKENSKVEVTKEIDSNKKESPNFKSMVDGDTLKTINLNDD